MTVINTNVGALQARTYAVRADGNVTKAMERLSSGLRINSAADDAAGLAVANKMESQIRGMNMAIRNSQDGISLVQTAESAMGEINNMVIRMRELAVQMNNGVYTDADRANAQLEVTALLAEIDKVADNSAFNQVKILDGTYSQAIRAGNTNPEVIYVTIDRMNTDALGGGRIATGVTAATKDPIAHVVGGADVTLADGSSTAKHFETTLRAKEGRPSIAFATLGLDAHANTVAGGSRTGTYSIVDTGEAGSDHDKFAVVNGEITLKSTVSDNTELDSETGDASYTFKVRYEDLNGVVVTDDVTLRIEDRPVTATTTPLTGTVMEAEEGVCLTIDAGAGANSLLSDQTLEFIRDTNNSNPVVYTLEPSTVTGFTGDLAAGGFAINDTTGEITGSVDFERPTDGGSNNSYQFTVVATRGTSVVKETITLNVTDFQDDDTSVADEAQWDDVSVDDATEPNIMSTGSFAVNTGATSAAATGAYALTAAGVISADFNTFSGAYSDDGDGWSVVSVGGADAAGGVIGTGITLAADGDLSVNQNTAVAGTIEDVLIRYTADTGETFEILTDFVVTDVAGAAGAAPDYTEAAVTGNHSTITVKAGGEAAVLDLTVNEPDAAVGPPVVDDTSKFDALAAFYADNQCGLFTVENPKFNGAAINDGDANENAVKVNNSGQLILEEGLAAGLYSFDVRYETNDGATFLQRMDITVEEIGIRGENGDDPDRSDNAVPTTASVISHATSAAEQIVAESEQVAGVSVVNIAEARQGTLQSVGTESVLSSAFNTFVSKPDYANGTFSMGSLNGSTDADLFTIDAKTGEIKTKGLVDYESKTEYNFTVTYTTGDQNNPRSYTEDVTVRVADDKVDNTTHIIDVNLGTQDSAATAVGILDQAINQISSSQAKLGAIQNRLQYNIDNLSKATMLTQTAKGRIMDADFAAETSELSKQQILSQAATSMLAQANQSKQSVLALLQ